MLINLSPAATNAFLREAYEIAKQRVAARAMSTRRREFRGAMEAIRSDRAPEIMLAGPAGTGKSLGVLDHINALCWEYPGIRVLIVRKVRADIAFSALVTFENHVLGPDNPICRGVMPENRRVYRYPNGSEIVIGGLDRVTSVMSQEYDVIYVQEAVEVSEAEWEALSSRLRNGVLPWQQMLGDTNPDAPDHWIQKRETLKVYYTVHKDNPAYWDAQRGDWTQAGVDYVQTRLAALTGLRRARLYEGKWVMAEGAVYPQWDTGVHVIDRFEIPKAWRRIRMIDFGYTNPFVCLWVALDEDDRMYLYREIYKTQTLVEDHARRITELSAGEQYEFTVADHDAEDRATLARHGITTVAAHKAVSEGIQAVSERLKPAGDGRPRLFIFRDALVDRDPLLEESKRPTCTRQEFGGYVWNDKVKREEPVKADDHGLDALRYGVMALTKPHAKPISIVAKNVHGRR